MLELGLGIVGDDGWSWENLGLGLKRIRFWLGQGWGYLGMELGVGEN